jgi:ligand-binding sensor domain-containing protein
MKRFSSLLLCLLLVIPFVLPTITAATPLDITNLSEFLPDNFVSTMTFDGQTVWVGTWNGIAAYSVKEKTWKTIGKVEGLESTSVTAIYAAGTNQVYIGTSFSATSGLFLLEDGLVTRIALPMEGAISVTALGMMNNHLHVGTFGQGLFVKKTDSFQRIARNSSYITDITVRDHSLYAATKYTGVIELTDHGITTLDDHTSEIPNNTVSSVKLRGTDEVWFGSWGGATRRTNGQWTTYFKQTGKLLNNNVKCLELDAENVYMGTDSGLSILTKNNKFTNITTEDFSLPSDNILSMVKVENDLWIGTDKGLIRIAIK